VHFGDFNFAARFSMSRAMLFFSVNDRQEFYAM
jgi:hypothetical protein